MLVTCFIHNAVLPTATFAMRGSPDKTKNEANQYREEESKQNRAAESSTRIPSCCSPKTAPPKPIAAPTFKLSSLHAFKCHSASSLSGLRSSVRMCLGLSVVVVMAGGAEPAIPVCVFRQSTEGGP